MCRTSAPAYALQTDRWIGGRRGITVFASPLTVAGTAAAAPAATAGTQTVSMQGSASIMFSPTTLSVHTGTVDVHFSVPTNAPPHTFGIKALGVDTGIVQPGASKDVTFTVNKPGSYAINCNIHPNMHATLVVTAASSSGGAPSQMQQVPSGPPNTGGGSTAGIEDAGLLAAGGLALAGAAGTLAYRRRVTVRRSVS